MQHHTNAKVALVVVTVLLAGCGQSVQSADKGSALSSRRNHDHPVPTNAQVQTAVGNSIPSFPVESGPFQSGGLSMATKWLEQHSHTAARIIPLPGGDVVLTRQPGWALYVNTVDQLWVQLPLPLGVLSFERRTKGGGLLFLVRGPMDDGPDLPFPYQVLCTPGRAAAFVAQQGPMYYPVSASVRFGYKLNERLTSVVATTHGIRLGFGPQRGDNGAFGAGSTSVPPTDITYDASVRALVLKFSKAQIGRIGDITAVHGTEVKSVRTAETAGGVEVRLLLAPGVRYYTGTITRNQNQFPFLQIDLAKLPPASPFGP